MDRDRTHFLLLNMGHFLDHLFTLVFATVAALALSREWGADYAILLAYATPGFLAFGLFALPAGWLADRWSRDGMMVVFFIGIGFSAIATGFATSPLQVGVGLFVVGIFAAIYHPVGLAILTERWRNTGMRIAVNGVFGNFGVGGAALIAGTLIDHSGWRSAFIVPGIFSITLGIAYAALRWSELNTNPAPKTATETTAISPTMKAILLRISIVVFATTALSSIVFQSTTFALPKIFDERLQNLAHFLSTKDAATTIGGLAFAVFAIASMAQLIVGKLLDRLGPRTVFITVAIIQIIFFALMPGLHDSLALAAALGFMLGAFGQIPINDYMIGKMASGPLRASIFAIRYVVSFTTLAAALPLIALVYANWGFDTLFLILATTAALTLAIVTRLPRQMPAVG
ncbi:MAG: MFS transporter [Acetobacteraceae bacterium]|nr:MFS transporter [Acetobacteraceae bacterium]